MTMGNSGRRGTGRETERATNEKENTSSWRPLRRDSLRDRLRGRLSHEMNDGKNRIVGALDDVATTVRRVGEPLHERPLSALGGYADQAAEKIEEVAARLRTRNIEQLAGDLGDLARRRPAVFVGAGLAAGLLAGRFMKSSAEETARKRTGRKRIARMKE